MIALCLAGATAAIGVAGGDAWILANGKGWAEDFTTWPLILRELFHHSYLVFYPLFIGALFVGWRWRRITWLRFGLSYGVAQLLTSITLVNLAKIAFGRARPYTGEVAWIWGTLESDFHSFPSGHAADVLVGFAVTELSPSPRWVKIAAGVVAALTLVSRPLRNQHYMTDLAAGAFLAYLGTLLVVWWLVLRPAKQSDRETGGATRG